MEKDFYTAMLASGITCQIEIIPDGVLRRFANNSKREKNGWYILFENGGAFGEWGKIDKQTWVAPNQALTQPSR